MEQVGITNQVIVFTGELVSISKKEGQQLAQMFGGKTQYTVTDRTTLLICGLIKNRRKPTESEVAVDHMLARGYKVGIITEQEFLIRINQELVKRIHLMNH